MSNFHASKSKVKSRAFTMKLGDLPNMVDAVFDGDHKRPGWVHMFANAKGCYHTDGLFPQVQIEWHEVGPSFPANWRGVKVNLPEAVSSTQTNLPLEVIPAGRTIDDGSPDQLALLLAFGVRRDGGRAASQLEEICGEIDQAGIVIVEGYDGPQP